MKSVALDEKIMNVKKAKIIGIGRNQCQVNCIRTCGAARYTPGGGLLRLETSLTRRPASDPHGGLRPSG